MAEAQRLTEIATALRRALAVQGAERVDQLDLDLVAADIVSALDGHPRLNPLDPEGDGLTPRELNSANDV